MPDRGIHVVVREEDGALWATVDEFPGVFATGDDLEELRESLAEGISLYLAEGDLEPRQIRLSPLRRPHWPRRLRGAATQVQLTRA